MSEEESLGDHLRDARDGFESLRRNLAWISGFSLGLLVGGSFGLIIGYGVA